MKKALSILLTILLVLTLAPLGAFNASATTSLTDGLTCVATAAQNQCKYPTYSTITDITGGGILYSTNVQNGALSPYAHGGTAAESVGAFPGNGIRLQFNNYTTSSQFSTHENYQKFMVVLAQQTGSNAGNYYRMANGVGAVLFDTKNGKLQFIKGTVDGGINAYEVLSTIATDDALLYANLTGKAFTLDFAAASNGGIDVAVTIDDAYISGNIPASAFAQLPDGKRPINSSSNNTWIVVSQACVSDGSTSAHSTMSLEYYGFKKGGVTVTVPETDNTDSSVISGLAAGLTAVAFKENEYSPGNYGTRFVTNLNGGGVSIIWTRGLSGYTPYRWSENLGEFVGDGMLFQFSNYKIDSTTYTSVQGYGKILFCMSSTLSNDCTKIKKDVPFLEIDTVNGSVKLRHCLDENFGASNGFADDETIIASNDIIKYSNIKGKPFTLSIKPKTDGNYLIEIDVEGSVASGTMTAAKFNAIANKPNALTTYVSVGGIDNDSTNYNKWGIEFYGYKRMPHIYDTACDTDCNYCGYIRNITHTYDHACDTDCNVCGVTRETEHNFEWVIDKEETVFENGYKHEECTICGTVQSENTVIASLVTYAIDNGAVTITGCDTSLSGDVVIPEKIEGYPVVSIGDSAFYGCENITSIELPSSIKSIGNSAFYYCCGFETITIPDSINNIGDEAFYNCYNLEKIIIGNGVKTIGYRAFYHCTDLTGVFYNGVAADKKKIVIALGNDCLTNNSWFCNNGVVAGKTGACDWTLDGTVLTISGNGAMADYNRCVLPWGTLITEVVIEEGVTHVGHSAFYNCNMIKTAVVPDSVTSIGASAFGGCSSLECLTLPFVGNTFNGTHYKNFGYIFGAYYSSYNENYVPASLKTVIITNETSIAANAFNGCNSIANITIPDSVISVGDGAFANCGSLENVYVSDLSNWINIEFAYNANPLCNGANLYLNNELVTDLVIPEGEEIIKQNAFNGCTSIKTVKIPASVALIDSNAFRECQIGKVDIEDIAAWCNIRFGYDANPVNAGAKLYLNGELLTKLVIPNGVTNFETAFMGCTSITSVTIPEGVTKICYSAFENCSNLISVTIPSSVNSIDYYAFAGCNIAKVYISDIYNWCEIEFGSNPLSMGANLYLNGALVTELVIPEGIERLGSAFTKCLSIKRLVIPGSVKSIGDNAFAGCLKLSDVTIGNGVNSVGKCAFEDCDSLTRVTISDSVTSVGNSAFAFCSNLTDVYMGNGVETIGTRAFFGCGSLKSITIPKSVVYIGTWAFDATSITDVYITDLEAWCGIKLDFNPLSMGANLHLNGELVTDLVLPEGITTLGTAFKGCESIRTVTIPESVVTIGAGAFYNCTNLTEVYIPVGVALIDSGAFDGSNVETVYFAGDELLWDEIVIRTGNNTIITAEIVFNHGASAIEPVSVVLCSLPTNTEFVVNKQTLDLSGCMIEITYSDGSVIKSYVTQDMVTGFDNTKLGSQTLTITYDKFTVQYNVRIIENIIKSIEMVDLPDREVYVLGQPFDATGAKIQLNYADGTKETKAVSANMVSGYNANAKGEQLLTVSYDNCTTIFAVKVVEMPTIKNMMVTIGDDCKTVEIAVDEKYTNYYDEIYINADDTIINDYRTVGNDVIFVYKTTGNSVLNISLVATTSNGEVYNSGVTRCDLSRYNGTVGRRYKQFVNDDCGDANGDGKTDIKDLVRIKKVIAGLAAQTDKSDLGQDGSVTTLDLLALAKVVVSKGSGVEVHAVTFADNLGNVFETVFVPNGFAVKPTVTPKKDGYVFVGWDTRLSNVTADRIIYGLFERTDSSTDTDDSGSQSGVNVNGYRFVIQSAWMAKSAKDAVMEQEKIFYRVASQIEEKYGCTIKVEGGIMTMDNMRTLIMSGSKVADAVELMSEQILPFAAAGYIAPWEKAGIDATANKFVQGHTNIAKVDGDYYGISCLRAPEARMCVVFNKGILKSAGINADGIYDLVKAKKWTWDTMRSYAKTVVQKNTSGGVTNVWGVGGWFDKFIRGLYVSNGAGLATTKSGKGVTTFASANMKEALNFASKLVNEDKVYDATNYRNANAFDMSDNGYYEDQFSAGKLAFLFDETYWVSKYFNKSFDYGIVPVPMGPKASNYITESGKARVWTLTSTNAKSKTIDESVTILNMLAEGCAAGGDINAKYDGEDWWQYDLKQEYFRNDKDKNLEMYNICLNTAAVDYGVQVGSLKEAFDKTVVRDALFCSVGTIESAIQKMGSQYDKAVQVAFTFKNK